MNTNIDNPWLGLSFYDEEHKELFYGRESEIEELYHDIKHNTQTVIFGTSGIGKTSIIKAGIFGKAREENFLPVYIRLMHDSKESYASQIIGKIKESIKDKNVLGEIENKISPISDNTSLWEFLHINSFWDKKNYPLIPLLVIDQFEEIFTLVKDKEKVSAFFEELSDLCDNKIPLYIQNYLSENKIRSEYPDKINYRIVLSLREDFLARLEEQSNHIPSLRRNRFSLQAINGIQAMEIILKPSKGIVSENVALEIIKKIANIESLNKDNLPETTLEPALLSLFCNELYEKYKERGETNITRQLVEEFGDNIIADFYRRTMGKVRPETAIYLEQELLTDGGFRDAVALDDVLARGITKDEIDILRDNRLIRIEKRDGIKRIEFTHDILCKPAKECRDKRGESERIEKLKKRNKTLIISIISATFAICAIGCVILLGFFVPYTENYENIVKINGFPKGVGKELSKEELSSTSFYLKLSRKGWFGRKGIFWGDERPFKEMEAYTYGNLTGDMLLGTYLVDINENSKTVPFVENLKTVCRWKFIADEGGDRAVQEIAYGLDSSVVYVFNMSRAGKEIKINLNLTTNNKGEQAINGIIKSGNNATDEIKQKTLSYYGVYTDAIGTPLRLRGNKADRVQIYYDDLNREERVQFYDAELNSCENGDGVYGQKYEYDTLNRLLGIAFLDEWGDYKCGKDGYAICRYSDFDKKGRYQKTTYYDIYNDICNNSEGFAILEWKYDDSKNYKSKKYYDKEMQPVISKNDWNAHFVEYYKDSKGNDTIIIFKGIDKKPVHGDTVCAKHSMQYNKVGNITYEELLNESDLLVTITPTMIANQQAYYSKKEYKYDETGENIIYVKATRKTTSGTFVAFYEETTYYLSGEIKSRNGYYIGDMRHTNFDFDWLKRKHIYYVCKYEENGNSLLQSYSGDKFDASISNRPVIEEMLATMQRKVFFQSNVIRFDTLPSTQKDIVSIRKTQKTTFEREYFHYVVRAIFNDDFELKEILKDYCNNDIAVAIQFFLKKYKPDIIDNNKVYVLENISYLKYRNNELISESTDNMEYDDGRYIFTIKGISDASIRSAENNYSIKKIIFENRLFDSGRDTTTYKLLNEFDEPMYAYNEYNWKKNKELLGTVMYQYKKKDDYYIFERSIIDEYNQKIKDTYKRKYSEDYNEEYLYYKNGKIIKKEEDYYYNHNYELFNDTTINDTTYCISRVRLWYETEEERKKVLEKCQQYQKEREEEQKELKEKYDSIVYHISYTQKLNAKDKYDLIKPNGQLPELINCAVLENIFKTRIVKVIQVSSKETNAYKEGIQDGDILLEYGDWKFSFEKPNWKLLDNEIKRLKNKTKKIVVGRPDVETYKKDKKTKRVEVNTFQLPEGKTGIRLNKVYYTEKEKVRLNELFK